MTIPLGIRCDVTLDHQAYAVNLVTELAGQLHEDERGHLILDSGPEDCCGPEDFVVNRKL